MPTTVFLSGMEQMIYTYKKKTLWKYLHHIKWCIERKYFHKQYRKFVKNYLHHIPSNRHMVCSPLDGMMPYNLSDLLIDCEEIESIFGYMKKNNLLNGHAVDVGANSGLYSLYFANCFDHVYAFEPHPISFSLLEINIKYCNLKQNITAYNYGLSSKEGVATLYEFKDSTSCATFEKEFATKSINTVPHFKCHLKTLKEENFRDKKIRFLKIDVENHELEVLKGAKMLIKSHKPVILIEDWKSKSGKKSDVIKFLENLGYNSFLVPSKQPLKNRSILGKIKYASKLILYNGQSCGLAKCDFSSSRGYPHILCESKE